MQWFSDLLMLILFLKSVTVLTRINRIFQSNFPVDVDRTYKEEIQSSTWKILIFIYLFISQSSFYYHLRFYFVLRISKYIISKDRIQLFSVQVELRCKLIVDLISFVILAPFSRYRVNCSVSTSYHYSSLMYYCILLELLLF